MGANIIKRFKGHMIKKSTFDFRLVLSKYQKNKTYKFCDSLYLCTSCMDYKTYFDFNKAGHASLARDGRSNRCRSCQSVYKTEYYKENASYISDKRKAIRGLKTLNCKCGCGEEFTTSSNRKFFLNTKHKDKYYQEIRDQRAMSLYRKAKSKAERKLSGRSYHKWEKWEDKIIKAMAKKYVYSQCPSLADLCIDLGRTTASISQRLLMEKKKIRRRIEDKQILAELVV